MQVRCVQEGGPEWVQEEGSLEAASETGSWSLSMNSTVGSGEFAIQRRDLGFVHHYFFPFVLMVDWFEMAVMRCLLV